MTEHSINLDLDIIARMRDGTGHTIFSPSSSAMWLTCSGSLIPNVLATDSAGEDAAYGTVAHGLTEYALKTGRIPVDRIGDAEWVESGDWGFIIQIDEDMLRHVETATDYCLWLPGDHFVELRLDYSPYTPIPNQGGTSDHLCCAPGLMTVTDHKFGKGITVYAAENYDDPRIVIVNEIDDSFELNGNTQGALYALQCFLKYDHIYHFEKIVIRISQPRLDHFDEFHTTREHLLEFAEWMRGRAAAAWKPNAPRRASAKGCQWCKVKGDCVAWAVMEEDIVSAAFADLIGGEVTVETAEDLKRRLDDTEKPYQMPYADAMKLTTEQLSKILTFRGASERWFKKIEETLFARAQDGETLPFQKMAESRSHRAWAGRGAEALTSVAVKKGTPITDDDVFVRKEISPADAERLLASRGLKRGEIAKVLQPLTRTPPGRPTLVPRRDKRPELGDSTAGAFDDLVDDSF